ncbi:MAG: pyruvate kinase [Acidiferrobacter sp.]
MLLPKHLTKIVCTIGPATDAPETLERMLRAGMNVARINLAHGSTDEHRARIRRIRRVATLSGKHVAILADLPGPKLRIGILSAPMMLNRRGERVFLGRSDTRGLTHVPAILPRAASLLARGDIIYLNDGFIILRLESADQSGLCCHVLVGGLLRSHKGINIPALTLSGGAFTAHDRTLLAFAKDVEIDAIGVSFVEQAADISHARSAANAMNYNPFFIAKIERRQAWHNIDAILAVADGIMVARGDLGVEVPIETVAAIQKTLIRKARVIGKPVITATQMLESMVHNRRPTRAEVTDVANAILDGTDCVMLSEESAVGDYPVDATRMLARIATVTERTRRELSPLAPEALAHQGDTEAAIVQSLGIIAERLHPLFVVVATETGTTARLVARYRMLTWILAVSPHKTVCQDLLFSYGIYPVRARRNQKNWENVIRTWLADNGIVKGRIILTQGRHHPDPGNTNRIEVLLLEDPLKPVVKG